MGQQDETKYIDNVFLDFRTLACVSPQASTLQVLQTEALLPAIPTRMFSGGQLQILGKRSEIEKGGFPRDKLSPLRMSTINYYGMTAKMLQLLFSAHFADFASEPKVYRFRLTIKIYRNESSEI